MGNCRETSLGVQPSMIPYGPSCIAFGAFSSSFFMASSSHRAATKAQPFPCHLLTPLIKLSLSSKSLFEQTSAVLEGKEGMSSLLQACRVAKSSSHVLTVLLTAEALWMHGILISDKPLQHGPGNREGCLGHSTNKEAAPNESISAPLPLQEGKKKTQSALKSGLTSQHSCLLC